jgi:hypothetical protein
MAARAVLVACLALVAAGAMLRGQEPPADSAPDVGAEEAPLPDLTRSRRWTDRNGRSVSGVFDRFIGDDVQLKVGAATQRIAYSAFSDEDQVILRRYMESRREGTTVPAGPKDLPDQKPRTWRDKSDRSVYGVLRRIDEQQRVVLQLDDRTATFVLSNFSPADQQHVREQLALLGRSDLLPPDDAIRTWRDWRGREFRGKLDPLHPPKSIVRTIHFLLDGGLRKSMDFVALSESDRELVRQLLEAEGGGDKLPAPFPEPDGEIRNWTVRNREPVEGKFVRLEGSSVILRTESDPERPLDLASLADEDRQYVEETLRAGGHRPPILRADCRQWTFGPAGGGNTVTAKFSEAAEGYVKLLLPDEDPPAEHPKFIAVPFLCLSAANQELVKQEWTGDAGALKPVPQPEPQIEKRDWTYDNDEVTVHGTLHYVTPSEVTIQAAVGLRRVPFAKLSGVDMDYVRRMIETYGMDQFAPPGAPSGPAGIVYSGPPPEEATSESGSGSSRLGLAHDEDIATGDPMTPGEFWMVIFGVAAGALAILGLVHLFMKAIT